MSLEASWDALCTLTFFWSFTISWARLLTHVNLEPYILCPWAPIWSAFGTHVDQMGAHGHKNVGLWCEVAMKVGAPMVNRM